MDWFFFSLLISQISMFTQQVIVGCVSRCSPYNNLLAQDGICRGAGCCRVPLTEDMPKDGVYFNPLYNTTDYYTNRSIIGKAYSGYAVIMESNAFRFNTKYLNTTAFFDEHAGRVPAILNWAVGNETCDVVRKTNDSYACVSANSKCVDSSRGSGYLCNCTEGYQGNPYLPDGCEGRYCEYTF